MIRIIKKKDTRNFTDAKILKEVLKYHSNGRGKNMSLFVSLGDTLDSLHVVQVQDTSKGMKIIARDSAVSREEFDIAMRHLMVKYRRIRVFVDPKVIYDSWFNTFVKAYAKGKLNLQFRRTESRKLHTVSNYLELLGFEVNDSRYPVLKTVINRKDNHIVKFVNYMNQLVISVTYGEDTVTEVLRGMHVPNVPRNTISGLAVMLRAIDSTKPRNEDLLSSIKKISRVVGAEYHSDNHLMWIDLVNGARIELVTNELLYKTRLIYSIHDTLTRTDIPQSSTVLQTITNIINTLEIGNEPAVIELKGTVSEVASTKDKKDVIKPSPEVIAEVPNLSIQGIADSTILTDSDTIDHQIVIHSTKPSNSTKKTTAHNSNRVGFPPSDITKRFPTPTTDTLDSNSKAAPTLEDSWKNINNMTVGDMQERMKEISDVE